MAKKRSTSKKKIFFLFVLIGLVIGTVTVAYLDSVVRDRFEGKRWKLPARVYARPLDIYPGRKLTPSQMIAELALLGYRETPQPREPGSFHLRPRALELVTRPFRFGDGLEESRSLKIMFADGRVQALQNNSTQSPLQLVRIEPALIGGIYPGKNEDRVLVKLDEVPQHVMDALIAVEDRRFYSHHGLDPRGIARAIFATASGKSVQGGSTLTQQLVKNFFLTPERTIRRKLTEMVMALLVELHYSKDEILETYINEVYLGQDGNRAIHGFGLASSYYFDKPLTYLGLSETALLVGMLKGPSYYSPRNKPQRALQRRNLVLDLMEKEGFITEQQLGAAKKSPLGVIDRPPRGTSPYPAFLTLVHRQLQRDYRDEDLRSEGLQVFTTLDPQVQLSAEHALSNRLELIEKSRKKPAGSLQGAVLVTSAQNAEVQAVVGDRDPRYKGFNRALDARRPIGSLIKPVVYLTALQDRKKYTLATKLDDSPFVYRQAGAEDWEPGNYDHEFHEQVLLRDGLIHSYNVSTARLGLDVGVSKVMVNLRRLGVERALPEFAASLLGANALSPQEVTQVYQTLASGGFRTPLRAIREVLTADGEPLQRYPLNVEQVIDPASLYLLTVAMQDVVREGTASSLEHYLPAGLDIAGKTGTTDDFRDSWFAGISGDRLAVVWIGRDDNEPTGLTGASGAMTVWGKMMASLNPEPLILPEPDDIQRVYIDKATGLRSAQGCSGAIELPFISGTAPEEAVPCGRGSVKKSFRSWFERIFGQ
ncbi:MAG: penicillin-binding protein 1B [Deltaproteobacteria bacterium]|nr:penicillin-binding protein 1B [Deltaproteobacteria bacterium]